MVLKTITNGLLFKMENKVHFVHVSFKDPVSPDRRGR